MNLEKRFIHLLEHWFTDETMIKSLWKELKENYSQPFRKYHNLTHLEELFGYFDSNKENLQYPTEVAYSIFYHDIIYSIWRHDNEEKSAEMAINYLEKQEVNGLINDRIKKHILATKTHESTLSDTKWMVDFDIAILGQSWEEYVVYAKNIRDEYRLIPNHIYKRGRRKVLTHFLNKKRIYKTDLFFDLYEANAIKNLTKELETL